MRRLNEMTFEEFRAAGLSINQSARLIAAREARGRFRSLDELDQVSNVARATIAELKQRLAFPDRTT